MTLVAQQCVNFFVAGFTGITTTLSFLLYELSMHNDVQDRLYQEISDANEQLGDDPLSIDVLQNVPYLDMVVSEVLRLWPVAGVQSRQVNKQYVIEDYDGKKVVLQPHDVVWIPAYGIHRDERFFANADVFDPERFSAENKKNIDMDAYMPFSFGPRACVASRFSIIQLKVVLYHLMLTFEIGRSEKTPSVMRLKTGPAQVH